MQLDSDCLTDCEYDAVTCVLSVRFAHGGCYRYFAVPAAVYRGLIEADSHGRYFHDHIRDRFPYERC